MPITLPEALAIAELARLAIRAADEHEDEEIIRDRYLDLSLALPDNHILRSALSLHDSPKMWRNIAAAVANCALREANGEDITINGASSETREAIDAYLAKRREFVSQEAFN